MSNPLTGDFDAVLQVSGATLNRLLASMHQNGFANDKLPSMPHIVQVRIGDDRAVDGVRGFAQVQVGCPRVELIHGATDRFIIVVDVRARYTPDSGSVPLPEFIHGTVRAEYRVRDIDPSCLGWQGIADKYVWVRVVRDSVQFVGTAQGQLSETTLITEQPVTATSDAENIAKITRQIAWQLATRFAAKPHRITSTRFKRGSLRSLNAPIGGSAVATPLSLNDQEPVGDVASINNLILEGSDLGIAVSTSAIMAMVEKVIAPLRTYAKSFPAAGTHYHATVSSVTTQWLSQTSDAKIKLKVTGSAVTPAVYAPNVTFDVDQDLLLFFDGASLRVVPGARSVKARASGPLAGVATNIAAAVLSHEVGTQVTTACTSAQNDLDALTGKTSILSDQLATFDDRAAVDLEHGVFLADGMILRGRIRLSSRKSPVIKFEKTVLQDGYTAFESWIPGGRIDTFEWSWAWNGARPGGRSTWDDRFLLYRSGGAPGRFGFVTGLRTPLPGLDGWGSVCLKVSAMVTDPITGALVSVTVVQKCMRFGYQFGDTFRQGPRPLVWDELRFPQAPELSRDVPFPQLAALGDDGSTPAANTLLAYVDRSWDRETADALTRGIERCGRYDAGLAVVVLFREGTLRQQGAQLVSEVEEIEERVGVGIFVNEDVQQSWSRVFSLDPERGQSWRLVSPNGTIAWRHDGRLDADTLTKTLDTHLHRSSKASPGASFYGPEIGSRISLDHLAGGSFEPPDAPCPPAPPLVWHAGPGTVVTFVHTGSPASASALRQVFAEYGGDDEGPVLVMVIEGADARQAEAIKNDLGLEGMTAVPDPAGAITRRFGVRMWPTTITIDESGTVVDVRGEAARSARHEGGPLTDTGSRPGAPRPPSGK
jgi:hypothetical protein